MSFNRAKYHFIPIIGSIVLLVGFLSYFLKSEYKKEKDAIRLEQREEIFVNIISSFDTLFDERLLNQEGSTMRWATDTSGTKVEYRLKYSDDSTIIPAVGGKLLFLDSIVHTPLRIIRNGEQQFPSTVTQTDTFISIVQHFGGADDTFRQNRQIELSATFDDPTLEQGMDLINFTGQGGHSGLISMDPAISVEQVLTRMVPQFLFSFLLLGIVLFSFYIINRSLRQAHQLTALKNDFISNISHELKTPVSTISVALEALRSFDAANDPRLRKEYLEISKMEAERLDMLVNKTLNISLFEQGKFKMEFQEVDVEKELDRILRSLKPGFEQKKVKLNLEKKGNNFEVTADPTHLNNVFYNLIENAVKYGGDPLELEIKLNELPENIEISINDNGPGIPKQFQDKIFDKFFRVPQGDVHNVKGHGLGLSYVHEIVNLHGGKIQLNSKEGEGSNFIIQLSKIKESK